MAVAAAVAGTAVLIAGAALAWPSSGGDEPDHPATASAEVAAAPVTLPPATTTPPTTATSAAPVRSVPTTEPQAALHSEDDEYGDPIGIACGEDNQQGDCCEFNDYADGECLEPGEWIDYGDYSGFCGCGETPPYDETTMALEALPDGRHAVILTRVNVAAGMVELDELDVQTAADATMTFTNPEIRLHRMYLMTGYDITGLRGNPSAQFWATVANGVVAGMDPAF
jgi:hypothetical protein